MARFEVFANPAGPGYLLDAQADVLDGLTIRVVVPLLPLAQAPRPAGHLNPVFAIAGADCMMATQFLSAVPRAMLDRPVASLAIHDTQISNALDMLLVGF